jgi:hypothetical protein
VYEIDSHQILDLGSLVDNHAAVYETDPHQILDDLDNLVDDPAVADFHQILADQVDNPAAVYEIAFYWILADLGSLVDNPAVAYQTHCHQILDN